MGSANSQREQKRGGGETRRTDMNMSAAAVAERARMLRCVKSFYTDIIEGKDTKYGRERGENLAPIHDYLFDFLNLHQIKDVQNYTILPSLLPQIGKVRWLYWRTLDDPTKVEIQDGDDGPLTKMFRTKFWQGVLVRVAGDRKTKAVGFPRGHFKTTLGSVVWGNWNRLRAPWGRTLIQTGGESLASDILGSIKAPYERNDRFRRLFGHHISNKRDGRWNESKAQLWNERHQLASEGKEASFECYTIDSTSTGGHCDTLINDDVVTMHNVDGVKRDKIKARMAGMGSVLDPGGLWHTHYTAWAEDDANSIFTDGGEFAEDACFMVATLFDDDESVPQPKKYTPLEHGKPFFPKIFTPAEIKRKYIAAINVGGVRFWYSQYFMQFFGSEARIFKSEWVQFYEAEPRLVAHQKDMNIVISMDSASGKRLQEGKLDPTAIVTQGQTRDKRDIYVLDIEVDKLPSQQIISTLVATLVRWRGWIAKGATVKLSFEETAYTSFLEPLIKEYCRARGIPLPQIILFDHGNERKIDRIRTLATPFEDGRYYLPKTLPKTTIHGEPYCAVEKFMNEFRKFPGVQHDDILDATSQGYLAMPGRMPGSAVCGPKEQHSTVAVKRGDDHPKNFRRANGGVALGIYG